jgi:hypothetical protein
MGTLLINPGSRIGEESAGAGWTNTFKGAQAEALRWLQNAHDDGLTDVEIVRFGSRPEEGRWSFFFRHKVTGVEAELQTHGIDNMDAYLRQYIFTPRVYWKGSSCSSPELDDFKAPGFRKLQTYTAC